jgi:excisionase family DNA binding protein
MITTRQNRLDPSTLDQEELDRLVAAFSKSGHLALIDEEDHRTELPKPLYDHLIRIVRFLNEKKAVVMIPEKERFTTQAAANYLGMSRQHLVDLIEAEEIPCIHVGKHRRIEFSDLLAYEKVRDQSRREALDRLTKKIDKAGLYDSDYAGEE